MSISRRHEHSIYLSVRQHVLNNLEYTIEFNISIFKDGLVSYGHDITLRYLVVNGC